MKNYIFEYYGTYYVTTFGTNHYRPSVPMSSIPESILEDLRDSMIHQSRVERPTFTKDSIGGILVSGVIYEDGIEKYLDCSSGTPIIHDKEVIEEVVEEVIEEKIEEKQIEEVIQEEKEEEYLVKELYEVIDEWIENVPDFDRIKSEGDSYCIENNWHWEAGYYFIDNTKLMLRYYHSDSFGVDKILSIEDVIKRRKKNDR